MLALGFSPTYPGHIDNDKLASIFETEYGVSSWEQSVMLEVIFVVVVVAVVVAVSVVVVAADFAATKDLRSINSSSTQPAPPPPRARGTQNEP